MKNISWLAPCANILCLIHCIGFSILGVTSPFFLSVLSHNWWLDYVILLVNALLGYASIKTMGLSMKNFYSILFLVFLGLIFSVAHMHQAFHLVVIVMAAIQLHLLYQHHKVKKSHNNCCDHPHK